MFVPPNIHDINFTKLLILTSWFFSNKNKISKLRNFSNKQEKICRSIKGENKVKNKKKKISPSQIPSWEYSECARINSEDNYVCVRRYRRDMLADELCILCGTSRKLGRVLCTNLHDESNWMNATASDCCYIEIYDTTLLHKTDQT